MISMISEEQKQMNTIIKKLQKKLSKDDDYISITFKDLTYHCDELNATRFYTVNESRKFKNVDFSFTYYRYDNPRFKFWEADKNTQIKSLYKFLKKVLYS